MLIKARSVKGAVSRGGVGGCVGVWGGGGGAYVSKRVIVSRIEEEALLLLYLQLYVAFLDHFSSPLNFSFSSLPFCLLYF